MESAKSHHKVVVEVEALSVSFLAHSLLKVCACLFAVSSLTYSHVNDFMQKNNKPFYVKVLPDDAPVGWQLNLRVKHILGSFQLFQRKSFVFIKITKAIIA